MIKLICFVFGHDWKNQQYEKIETWGIGNILKTSANKVCTKCFRREWDLNVAIRQSRDGTSPKT
jgi:hypothetical protein